jgi:hypothetical protein
MPTRKQSVSHAGSSLAHSKVAYDMTKCAFVEAIQGLVEIYFDMENI